MRWLRCRWRLVTLAAVMLACTTAHAEPPTLPEGDGRETVARVCAQCHSLEIVMRARLTRKQWEARIDVMIAKGAKLSDEDIDLVAAYLATHFGPPASE